MVIRHRSDNSIQCCPVQKTKSGLKGTPGGVTLRTGVGYSVKDKDSPHADPWSKLRVEAQVADRIQVSKPDAVGQALHGNEAWPANKVFRRHVGPVDAAAAPARRDSRIETGTVQIK